MPERIRTIHWGTGAMGARGLAVALEDPRFEVAGVISARSPDHARDVLRESGGDSGAVAIARDLAELVAVGVRADVVVLATGAHVREFEQQVLASFRAGLCVVGIGEELLHPASAYADGARRLMQAAVRHGVAAVGTGVNPGFLMDTLPLVLTAPTRRWSRLHARRVSDLSSYGWTVLQGLGVGLGPAEFDDARVAGRVGGHLGFPESVAVIGEGLDIPLSIVENSFAPIVRGRPTSFRGETIAAGLVVGVYQRCVARSAQGHSVALEHPQRIGTLLEEEEPFGDLIEIEGEPSLRLRISPAIDGAEATIALMLNAVPGVLQLSPGLHAASDMPLASLGSARIPRRERVVPASGAVSG